MDAAAAAASVSTLSALAVFVSTVHQGAVRSAHGYRVVGRREWERWVEREFAFSASACREVPLPVGAPRILPTDWRGRPVFREGQLVGPWRCILAFDSVAGVLPPPNLPPLLSPTGNARLVCCVPSLYNDLLKLFPIQKLEKVPELIQCDSGEQKAPLVAAKDVIPTKKVQIQCGSAEQKAPLVAAKDVIPTKKVHIQCGSAEEKAPLVAAKDVIPTKKVHIQCGSAEEKAPLVAAKDVIPTKKVHIQCGSAEQKAPLVAAKDIIPMKVHTELFQCGSAQQKTPLDTISNKVHIQCGSAEQKTHLDIIPKKVHTEPIQCGSDEQKTPLALDTKDRIPIKVQQSGSYSDEQRTFLDTNDRIPIKVQQSEPDSDEQRTPLDTNDRIPIKVQQSEPGSDEQRAPLDIISVKVQKSEPGSDEQLTPLDAKDMIPIKVQQSGPDSDGHPQSGEEHPTPVQKQRRAQREYIASITLGDIAQYFHLPIREASRTLQIGLSILKKKCRQYGIPRWPHRKIKSLDSLIQDLEYVIDDTERDDGEEEEEEHTQKEKEKEDAIRSLAKRKRMLETEMATIQQKPTLDLMTETKQFRQFVFKRRYKAKHLVDE